MSAQDMMTRQLVTLPRSASLIDASEKMVRHSISRVIIARNDKGEGIVTEKDLIRFASADTSKRTLDEIRLSEIMSKPLITVKRDSPTSRIVKLMLARGIGSVAVLSDRGKLAGIVTKTDLCHHYSVRFAGKYLVKDFMTRNVITVKRTHSIFTAANLMNVNKISRLVVKGDSGEVVGIVTLSDMVSVSPLFKPRKLIERKYFFAKGFFAPARSIHLLIVGDVMTARPLTISERADLSEAASLLVLHRIGGLPVTRANKLVGVVSRTDIAKALSAL